jgi:hypothetical protein
MTYPKRRKDLGERTDVSEIFDCSFNHSIDENHRTAIEGMLAQVETGAWAMLESSSARRRRRACANECLDLGVSIREALLDHDANATCRHSLTLLSRWGELIGHADSRAPVHVPNWQKGIELAVKARQRTRDEHHQEWIQEANRYRSQNPGASDRATAKHVAEVCEAKFETVRNALRILRRHRVMTRH